MISESKLFSAYFRILLIFTAALVLLRGIFPVRYNEFVDKYSEEYGIEKELVLALIKAESNFSEKAVSHAGAKGLMQITDSTFLYCLDFIPQLEASADIFNPEQNISAGVWYLSYLLDRYGNNVRNAIAAYNAGPANVDKWILTKDFSEKGIIPFPETARHVRKIDKYRKIYKLLY